MSQIDREVLPHALRLLQISMCLHKRVMLVTSGVVIRTFYIEQMLVFVRMQFHNHVDTQPVKRFERVMRCMGGRVGLDILAKRVFFLVLSGKKQIALLLSPWKYFGKFP